MTLTEFLLERIAEDEQMARKCASYLPEHTQIEVDLRRTEGNITTSERVVPYVPARALAECEAKRRIVEEMLREEAYDSDHPYHGDTGSCEGPGLETAVLLLAAIYADHPDYREEWRP